MNWIKKNPAPFALALVSAGTLGLGSMLYSKVSAFPGAFSTLTPIEKNTVAPADLSAVEAAIKSAKEPAAWSPKQESGSLFVSVKYIEKGPSLLNPIKKGTMPLHPPIPNEWILANKLSITSSTLKTEDLDQDGFDNSEEFNGLDALSHLRLPEGATALQPVAGPNNTPLPADSTDPNDPKSHPPYLSKLRLVKIAQVPFRLILRGYDGNAQQKQAMTFFVNAVDRGGKTELLKIGDVIPSDPRYKLTDFSSKIEKNADGTETDKSELIIINTEYKDDLPAQLPLNIPIDSPESYAIFKYLWKDAEGKGTPDFSVKKNGEFTLQPESEKKYKLLKFEKTAVALQLTSGETVTIPLSQ